VDQKNALPGFLEGLFDRAVGVFDKLIDIETAKREIDLQRDVAFFNAGGGGVGGGQGFTSTTAPFSNPNQIINGVENTTLFIGAGIAIAGLVLLTR